MKYYSAIDLHSNNSFVVVLDENDKPLLEKRLPNDLEKIILALAPYKDKLQGVAVESTYNWYWLVDGLMTSGFVLKLVNTTAVKTYSGLKHSDDKHDAIWLAHLLRLGILPTGYIYPREARTTRDLLRKRMQLVQQRTKNLLSIKSFYARYLGLQISTNELYKDAQAFLPDDPELKAIMTPNITLFNLLTAQIKSIEKSIIKQHFKNSADFALLKSTPGIGDLIAMTVLLEIGDLNRFKSVGNFVSYCRCVSSQHISNNKKKGKGNVKNGNRYLAWAFHEAAHHAMIWSQPIKAFYQKKKRKTNGIIAIKAVSHKLARACYYMLKNETAFNIKLAFD
jgi:transposase